MIKSQEGVLVSPHPEPKQSSVKFPYDLLQFLIVIFYIKSSLADKNIPANITGANLEEDILLLEFFGGDPTKDKDKDKKKKDKKWFPTKKDINKFKNNQKKTWEICLTSKTPNQRQRFCKDIFSVSNIAQGKCEVIYII